MSVRCTCTQNSETKQSCGQQTGLIHNCAQTEGDVYTTNTGQGSQTSVLPDTNSRNNCHARIHTHTHTLQCFQSVGILCSFFPLGRLQAFLCLLFYPIRSSKGQLGLWQLGFSSGVRWNLPLGLLPATSITHTNTHTNIHKQAPSILSSKTCLTHTHTLCSLCVPVQTAYILGLRQKQVASLKIHHMQADETVWHVTGLENVNDVQRTEMVLDKLMCNSFTFLLILCRK